MKKLTRWLLCGLLSMQVLAQPIAVRATESSAPDASESESIAEQSHTEQMVQALQAIKALNRYKLTIEMEDIDTGRVELSGTMQVNREQRTLAMDLNWHSYDDQGTQHTYPFNLLAYDDLGLVYVKQVNWTLAQGISAMPYVTDTLEQQLEHYREHYTPIETAQLDKVSLHQSLADSLLFLPDERLARQIAEDKVVPHEDGYQVAIERTEIPTDLFKTAGQFQWGYRLNYQLLASEFKERPWQMKIDQTMEFGQKPRGFQLLNGLTCHAPQYLGQRTASQSEEQSESTTTSDQSNQPMAIEREFQMTSTHATHKMTKAQWTVDPKKQTYQVKLTGIAEKVMLNLFDLSTAKMNGAQMQLTLTYEPSDYEQPGIDSLKQISNREIAYLMTQSINAQSEQMTQSE